MTKVILFLLMHLAVRTVGSLDQTGIDIQACLAMT